MHVLNITSHAGHQASYRIPRKECHGKPLYMSEKRQPQIVHNRLSRVFHYDHMAKAEKKMEEDYTNKDQRNTGHPRIIFPPEIHTVSLFQFRKILVPNPCPGPFYLEERGISIDHLFNLWPTKVSNIEPLLLRLCSILIRDVLHDVAVYGHLCQIGERQVQNRNGYYKPYREKEQQISSCKRYQRPYYTFCYPGCDHGQS